MDLVNIYEGLGNAHLDCSTIVPSQTHDEKTEYDVTFSDILVLMEIFVFFWCSNKTLLILNAHQYPLKSHHVSIRGA